MCEARSAELLSIWFPRKIPFEPRGRHNTRVPPPVKIPRVQGVTWGFAVGRGLTWHPLASKQVHGASDTFAAPVEDVGVDHGGLGILVSEQLLDGADVVLGVCEKANYPPIS